VEIRNKKIKIVHIVEGFIGGVEKYLCNVPAGLVERGFDVSLICSLGRCWGDAWDKIERLEACGVKVYVIEMSRSIRPFGDVKAFVKIFSILRAERFDVVHTHCSKAGALGRVAGYLAGVSAIVHSPHCFAYIRMKNKYRAFVYKYVEKFLAVITSYFALVSMSEKEVAVRDMGARPERCFLVQNGVKTDEVKSTKKMKPSMTVLTACRLVEYKGLEILIEAAKLLKDRDVKFVIAGTGEIGGKLKEMVVEGGLEGKVEFAGYVSDMKRLYREADIVVLLSKAEGQPYVLLEAMRERCAFIATDVLGNSELIKKSGAGIAVGRCPDELAGKIKKLLEDRRELERLGENGYEYVRRYHSLGRQIRELVSLYENATARAREYYVYDRYSTV